MLEEEADVGGDRIVAQDGVTRLDEIANAEKDEDAEEGNRQGEVKSQVGVPRRNRCERRRTQDGDGQENVARSKRQQQITH